MSWADGYESYQGYCTATDAENWPEPKPDIKFQFDKLKDCLAACDENPKCTGAQYGAPGSTKCKLRFAPMSFNKKKENVGNCWFRKDRNDVANAMVVPGGYEYARQAFE